MNWRALSHGLIIIASLVVLGYLLQLVHLDKAWIDSQVRGHGMAGSLLFVAVGTFTTAIGLPRQIIAFLGAYAFGLVMGGLLGLLASVLGCVSAFYYARLVARRMVKARFPGRIEKIDNFIRDNPFSMTLLLRLFPAGSNIVTNLAAGVSSIRALSFFAGSALGYVPHVVVFALIGSGINVDPIVRISMGVVLFVVSSVLGLHLYRKYRRGKSVDEELDRELGVEDTQVSGSESR